MTRLVALVLSLVLAVALAAGPQMRMPDPHHPAAHHVAMGHDAGDVGQGDAVPAGMDLACQLMCAAPVALAPTPGSERTFKFGIGRVRPGSGELLAGTIPEASEHPPRTVSV